MSETVEDQYVVEDGVLVCLVKCRDCQGTGISTEDSAHRPCPTCRGKGRCLACLDGCGCRVGTMDAAFSDCGCPGPCTTGWDT